MRLIRMFLLVAVIELYAVISAGAAPSATWVVDPVHSSATFAVAHMGISKVRGEMRNIQGQAHYDGKNLSQASVEVTIDASTLNTREEKRDQHLKSPDFLNVEKYPNLVFKSKQFRQLPGNRFEIVGNLTIRDVTKAVVLHGEGLSQGKDMRGITHLGAVATTTIDRKDYGLVWNKVLEGGNLLVGNQVEITLDVDLVRNSQ